VQALHQWSDAHIKVYVASIRYRAVFTSGTAPIHIVVRDLSDAKFLSCGEETKADAIVTGDPDLLSIHRYKGIPIVSPNGCIQRFFPELLRRA
jgi:predicted nucleic acid-binding protein